MSDCIQGVRHSSVCQISLQTLVSMSVTVSPSPPYFISSAGMLSTLAALPLLSARIPASTSLRRIRWSSSFADSCQLRALGSLLIWWL